MSELDKEAVLDEFSAAYKEAHGKKPKVEDSNGWYSVDGGKNMRLAQIDEWSKELRAGKSKSAAKSSTTKKATSSTKKSTSSKKSSAAKPAEKTSTAKKSATKKAGAKKSAAKPAKKKPAGSAGSGQTPAQAWQAHLEQQAGASRLPRGFKG